MLYYKNGIERVKFHEDVHIRESMARKLAEGSSKCFWSDVKRINNTRVYSNIVEGLDEPEKICEKIWKNNYNGIFNCLGPSNEHITPVIDPYLNITIAEVVKSVSKLSSGKAAGLDGVTAENIKFAHPVLFFYILQMFNGFLMHGYLPNEFMSSSLTPTIKDPKGDITSTANYRPIAVSSIISKLFEFVLLNRIVPHLNLSSNQFGYCEGVGLNTCVYTMKEH